MKHTAQCTQCSKSFTHPTKQKAEQALTMHMGRKHKMNITRSNEPDHTGVLRQRANGTLAVAAPPVTGKRSYTRRVKSQPVKAEIQINFCPCCGTDIHAVATGMAMAAHLKK